MIVKLLTEHHLEFLSLKGGCRGSSESSFVKMSNCWKSYAVAHVKKHASLFSRTMVHCSFIAQSLAMVSRFLDVTFE